MIEIYVVLALGAFGYLLNSMSQNVKSSKKEYNKFEMPSMTNIYHSTASKKFDEKERKLAEKAYKEALQPRKTNRIMALSGEMLDIDSFKHNNMEPYFGGSIRQNMDVDKNRVLLENFTGVQDIPKNKCEVKSFYDQNKDIGLVHGMDNNDAFYRDRIAKPRIRNNEVPVEQVRVGPGLNLGYTANPAGGFQQFDDGEIARQGEKCVNELRVKTNPKESFEGRTLDGLKSSMRGDLGKMNKNRPERFYEQNEDQLFKTTGANLKPSQVPQFNVKPTNRLDTNAEIIGVAKGAQKRRADEGVKPSARQQLESGGIRNAILNVFGIGERDDHGKGNIIVYQNERDLTSTKTYQGNITSLVKAIIAPLEDILKTSRKEEFTDNPRPYGEINPQMPSKTTLQLSDQAKSTIKETTENATDNANLKGSSKIKIYHNDVAKTTLTETLNQNDDGINLKGSSKIQIYHDDVAKTTMAETLLQSMEGYGSIKGPVEIYVYDPDEVAKVTGRETLDYEEYHANVATVHKKQTLGPEDEMRVTIKQTTQDNLYDAPINALEKHGTYDDNYEAKTIARQFLADYQYTGDAKRDLGMGYETNEYDAKQTQKAFISDNDYYGPGEAATYKKNMSKDNYENAHVDERKEVLLFDREPTAQGSKEFNGNISWRPRKADCNDNAPRELNNLDKVYSSTPELTDRTITKNRMSVDLNIGDRLDPDLLDALRNNPYARRLGSVA